MSSFGVGQGLERGVQTAGRYITDALHAKMQNERQQKALDYDYAWNRGLIGLGLEDNTGQSEAGMGAMNFPPAGRPGSVSTAADPSQVGRFELPGQPLTALPTEGPRPPVSVPTNPSSPAALLGLSQMFRRSPTRRMY